MDENPEPFDIVWNARKKSEKVNMKNRKASYHNALT